MGWKKKRGEREYWKSFQPSNINHAWGEYAEWAEKEPYQYEYTVYMEGGNFWPRVLAALFPFIKIKGSVSQDFLPLFFSWFEPIWAPDKKAIKHFRILFRFHRDIQIKKTLMCAVPHTMNSDSTVFITAESRRKLSQETPRCASHRGVSNLTSVCFNPKFYNCYFSVMPVPYFLNT